jgi:DNA helicase-2/ATP-dependent DNA helicase PcrA
MGADGSVVLDPAQLKVVEDTEGPCIIYAGPGSGKSRSLVHRVAHLAKKGVATHNILVVTFTNKAVDVLVERLDKLIGSDHKVHVSTFHSLSAVILRRYWNNTFSIYDDDDKKKLITSIIKDKQYDKDITSIVMDNLGEAAKRSTSFGNIDKTGDSIVDNVISIYYSELIKANALDFDSIVTKCVDILKENDSVRSLVQKTYKYILVDEAHDMNTAQGELVKLMVGEAQNVCLVADVDQSIYGFRGADFEVVWELADYFKDTKVYKLERNYRSTRVIVNSARKVITNNENRVPMNFESMRDSGTTIRVVDLMSSESEATWVADDIQSKIEAGKYSPEDIAILYRVTAMSASFESKLMYRGIAYKVIGSRTFFAKAEIKDILAYLRVIHNKRDNVAVLRIINLPKRGIGAAMVKDIVNKSNILDMCYIDTIRAMCKQKSNPKLESFLSFIDSISKSGKLTTMVQDISRVVADFYSTDTNLDERINNIEQLYGLVSMYDGVDALSNFIEDMSLSIYDEEGAEDLGVYLMTMHQCKGLEFPLVYVVGAEQNVIPYYKASTKEQVEEERRLFYVSMTRAMDELVITHARARALYGKVSYNRTSMFVEELRRG